jgi:nickel-dependent lactate racemase
VQSHLEIPWGSSTLPVKLPENWNLLGTLEPGRTDPLPDPMQGLREALLAPLDAAPLRKRDLSGTRIVLAVEDASRPTPLHLFFGALKQELLAAGAREENISLLMALGVHRPMTREEVAAKVGEENLEGLSWFNHDAKDPHGLASLGTTTRGTEIRLNRRLAEADLILCVGGIEPHVLLGFSGGVKMLLPGCAGAETIARNHLQGVSPERFDLVGVHPDESPMRLDMEEAAGMLGREIFIVNAVMNHEHRICAFFCGHPVKAQRQGVELSRKIHGVPVPEPADVMLTCSAPMSFDLRQSMKCVGNNLFGVKPGGPVVGFLGCEQGIGDVDIPPKSLPHKVLRPLLRVLGPSRIMGFVDRVKKGAGVEEKFLAHFSLQVCRRNPLHLYADNLPEWVGKKTGLFTQYSDISRMMEAVSRKAPRNATVWFAPYGGITYPILPPGADR